jgi:hypothetical protein
MKRSDLEKLSKDELIDLNLALQDHIQTLSIQIQTLTHRITELETHLNLNSKNSHKPPSTDTWKNPKLHVKKQTKNPGTTQTQRTRTKNTKTTRQNNQSQTRQL